MITTLLFDLDDTLLDNDTGTFLPAYFKLLAENLAEHVAPDTLIAELMAGMRTMLDNDDPTRTLRQAFDARFYSALDGSRTEMTTAIEEFYREKFPTLQPLTGYRPEAREVLEWAFGAGLSVGIATNALYPLVAIEERLRWAGVGRETYNYALVASYETMHFAKPHPEYFSELIAKLGTRPDEALMIGDDWDNDILPASAAGLRTFWIAAPGAKPRGNETQPDGRGSLADFLRWARDQRCLETLEAKPVAPESLVPQLAGCLAAFDSAVAEIGDWKRRPAEGEWSLTEILCHLRDVEAEVNLPRLQRVVTEAEPFVSAADTDPWAVSRDYQSQDGQAAFEAFAKTRREAINFLRRVPPETWARSARHAILGRTTLAELVSFIVEHDRIHIRQVTALA